MSGKVRMADIANRLGISTATVSNAIAGRKGVSEEVRKRVLETARSVGYGTEKPEGFTRDDQTIGILMAYHFNGVNSFYSQMNQMILDQCTEAGYSARMEIISQEALDRKTLPALLLEDKADALIFLGAFPRDYLQNIVENCSHPYVLLDSYDETIACDSILSDNISGCYQLTEHLIKKGYRKIGFLGSIQSTSSNMDRYLGYYKALLTAGIKPRDDWRIEDRDRYGFYIPIQLPQELPEAFVCVTDEDAILLITLLREKGLRVPDDIAVTGYDDYFISSMFTPQLTTYRVNRERMVSAAVNTITCKLNGEMVFAQQNIIPGILVKRRST